MRFTKEIRYFLIIGILTVLIDYGVYSFSSKTILNISQAKSAGFLIGTIFAFFANRNLTFKSENKFWLHLSKFVLLYSGTLVVNVMINKFILDHLPFYSFQIYIAFFIATSSSALLNFFGMKHFVFKNKSI